MAARAKLWRAHVLSVDADCDRMTTSGVSGAASGGSARAELAVIAMAKTLSVQRAQADAMVALIQQAAAGSDVGRIISVRA